MRYTQAFIFTHKESGKDVESASHDLTVRAGLAYQVAAGHYDFLPMGTRVLRKVEGIIREEIDKAGAQEILMPIMQPATLWQESQRWEAYGEEMFKLKSRTEREFCLGPTHEELIVDLARAHVKSYKELPFTLYQFGTKFRDEKRPRGGLLRGKEFVMKDAYSFDMTEEGLNESYDKMREAYLKILNRTGVTAIPTVAQTGEMGGSFSEEFMAPSPAGEDKFVVGKDGKARKLEDIAEGVNESDVQVGIEICHIFKLGTRYSTTMGLTYMDQSGNQHPVIMGCYGIGVSRMLPTAIEQNHDDKGIIWPAEIAPFDVVVIPIRYDNQNVREPTDKVYSELLRQGFDVLLDDRDLSPGTKFKDHDLLGTPYKLIIGERGLKSRTVELEHRSDGKKEIIDLDNIVEEFSKRK
jgi:prolyl-tRNA synthetase